MGVMERTACPSAVKFLPASKVFFGLRSEGWPFPSAAFMQMAFPIEAGKAMLGLRAAVLAAAAANSRILGWRLLIT